MAKQARLMAEKYKDGPKKKGALVKKTQEVQSTFIDRELNLIRQHMKCRNKLNNIPQNDYQYSNIDINIYQMKAKIFLGEYAYIYRGNIDLYEINEYIKTITKRAYILKWKDQDEDMISVLKKHDLEYFYNKWNQKNNTQIFKLYVFEMFNQPGQAPENSQTQIQLNSPDQNFMRQQQLAFTFGPGHDFQNTNVQKSQELPRDLHRLSQAKKLESIQEQNESLQNLSDKNLDHRFFKQRHESIKMVIDELPQFSQTFEIQEGDIQQKFDAFEEQEMKVSITKRAVNREQFNSIPICIGEQLVDIELPSDESFDNVYCDYCSEKIDSEKEFYRCPFCRDIHICTFCFDNNQEYCHEHQLKLKS